MKTIITVALSLCFCRMSFGLMDLNFTGDVSGNDCYCDGTPLLDGECYALIWQRNGTEFQGFKADGTLVENNADNCVLCEVMPVAARVDVNGDIYAGCPWIIWSFHERDTEFVSAFKPTYTEGHFMLYALDTRIWKDGEMVVGGVDEKGKLKVVNAYSVVESLENIIPVGSRMTPDPPSYEDAQWSDIGDLCMTLADVFSPLPDTIPVPQFSWISVTNGIATVSVTNTATYLGYGLSMTNDLALVSSTTNFVTDKSGTPLFKQGVGEGPLTWEIDVSAYQQGFFKLLRKSVLDE